MNALVVLQASDLTDNDRQGVLVDGEKRHQEDYFAVRGGVLCAGEHLLLDLWEAHNLDDPDHIDASLRNAALAARATILHSHFHHFTPNGGVSGVLVLAESHISIHTWPERGFAAIDVFMCGTCDPRLSIVEILRAFTPERIKLKIVQRGIVNRD